MKTTWKILLASGAVFAMAACTPPEPEAEETAEVEEEVAPMAETAPADDMMEAEAGAAPDAAAEEGEGEEPDDWSNPAGPLNSANEE